MLGSKRYQARGAVFRLGKNISFNSQEVVFKGWSIAESSHRWSLGKSSEIEFFLPEKSIHLGNISLNIGTFGEQEIIISVNSIPV